MELIVVLSRESIRDSSIGAHITICGYCCKDDEIGWFSLGHLYLIHTLGEDRPLVVDISYVNMNHYTT